MALVIIGVILFVLTVGLVIYLALSSCLGDGIRNRHRSSSIGSSRSMLRRLTAYDEHYLQGLNTGDQENIEMNEYARTGVRRDSLDSQY